MDPSDTQAIKEFALDAVLQITQSEIGYIFLLNEDESIPKGEYCFALMQDRSELFSDCPALIVLDTGEIT